MRTTFRVIAAAFALLLATPALGASEFDIANAEHDANGGTNGAKRATLVDTSGDSAVDATANAVKVVVVDAAGTSATDISGVNTFGTGGAVICDATPANVDDTSVANTTARTIECCNPSTNTVTVRIGGAAVGANAAGTEPGICKAFVAAASVVPKCYAAAPTTIQCTEYK